MGDELEPGAHEPVAGRRNYYVVVTNAYGSATSSNALLTVNPVGVSLGTYPGLTVQGTPGKMFGIQYTTNVAPNSTWLTLTQFTLIQPIQMWFDADNTFQLGAIREGFIAWWRCRERRRRWEMGGPRDHGTTRLR